ncbi:alpha/beta hydrolase family protein [Fictibacillus sp. BK138]|uniref:alpha/beta hydrolase family protein n=1 Tax=Fictibacillus sp. BK138 TaxID=2512121 RepID=UPI0010289D7E|nr:alpha/beta fold hydrolase [Fictibacillus sp. BK138]RZT23995.1 prolyl oligopeptidase family protein [Fictibacillus sp. BK138]
MKRNKNDGKLISKVEVPVHSDFEGQITIFRIEYLVDELRVVGFIIRPRSDNKLPVLIYNRGGNGEYGKLDDERLYRLSKYALEGYVVLASQYRGNDGGEGKDAFGGDDVRDVFALSWLADELPYADNKNKVMIGHSRGGMMTYLCIKYGIDIKAAAVIGAPTNLLRRPLAFPMESILADRIGDFSEKRSEYCERSALLWPDKIKTPTLILHGDADSRVDYKDAEELAELLTKNNLKYKYVLYTDGDHALNKFEKERDREIFDWFSIFKND